MGLSDGTCFGESCSVRKLKTGIQVKVTQMEVSKKEVVLVTADGSGGKDSMRHQLVPVTRFRDRVLGFLIPRPEQCVLLISPCKSIHTFGMKKNLDIAFVDSKGVIICSERGVSPGNIRNCWKAYSVLERYASATDRWYRKGERVIVDV